MKTLPWFRVYNEIKDDPKMLTLDDHQFRLWIGLLAMASESRERGTVLPCPRPGLIAALRTTAEALQAALDLFAEMDMAFECEDGAIVIIHFLDRQYDNPSDRPEATRDRKRKQRQAPEPTRDTPASPEDVTRGHEFVTIQEERRVEEIRGEETRGDTGVVTTPGLPEPAPVELSARKPVRKPAAFEPDSDEYRLGALLRALILEADPDANVPKLDSAGFWRWCNDFRGVLKRRKAAQVESVIRWCRDPSCWWLPHANNARKFVEHFDTMYGQMRAPPRPLNGGYRKSPSAQEVPIDADRLAALEARL